jgi:hypothetical protein
LNLEKLFVDSSQCAENHNNGNVRMAKEPALVREAGFAGLAAGKFECIGRRRSAWCGKAELSGR